MRKPKKELPMKSMKVCNRCGEMVLVYEVFSNAPICENCQEEMGLKKSPKKVPNEKQMVDRILKKNENQKIL